MDLTFSAEKSLVRKGKQEKEVTTPKYRNKDLGNLTAVDGVNIGFEIKSPMCKRGLYQDTKGSEEECIKLFLCHSEQSLR